MSERHKNNLSGEILPHFDINNLSVASNKGKLEENKLGLSCSKLCFPVVL